MHKPPRHSKENVEYIAKHAQPDHQFFRDTVVKADVRRQRAKAKFVWADHTKNGIDEKGEPWRNYVVIPPVSQAELINADHTIPKEHMRMAVDQANAFADAEQSDNPTAQPTENHVNL